MTNKKENTEILAIVDLTQEYPGWTGEEQWAVVSDCSGINIYNHPEVKKHQPCLFMTEAQWEVIKLSRRNENKFEKRDQLYHDLFGYEDIDIDHNLSFSSNPVLDEIVLREIYCSIKTNSVGLTEVQHTRTRKYYVENKTIEEIALEENTGVSKVFKSIHLANKKIEKYFSE